MKKQNGNEKKLVLFDIDGTLINTRNSSVKYWKGSIEKAFAEVFRPLPVFNERSLNGKLERQYFRELADLIGVPREEFARKFHEANRVFTDHFISAIDAKSFELYRIAEAYEFVSVLHKTSLVSMGILTGNNERLARVKLRVSGFDVPFAFGAFGDQADDRGELVHRARERATDHFRNMFAMHEVVVIGDTKYDVEAAKYAGAYAIGVTTGLTDTAQDLKKAGADMIVSSLMDPKIMALFHS